MPCDLMLLHCNPDSSPDPEKGGGLAWYAAGAAFALRRREPPQLGLGTVVSSIHLSAFCLSPCADAFIPERFDPDSPLSAGNNMAAYIPFGLGPRMCLGYKFALQEATLALIQLYSSYTFKMPPSFGGFMGKKAIAALPVDTGIIVKPQHGLHVHVVKRALF